MPLNGLLRPLPHPPADISWAWALERSTTAPLKTATLTDLRAPPQRPPREDELWLLFATPAVDDAKPCLDFLSEDERARAARFHFAHDMLTFCAARASVRILLARMLGQTAASLRLTTGAKGKPQLAAEHRAVQFNLSHTSGAIAIAFSGAAVGLDMELRRERPNLLAMAGLAFAPEACAALEDCADETGRVALFHRFWTLGEAYIKATGQGVSQGLKSFVFTSTGAPALTRASPAWGPPERWRFDCGPR